MDTTPATGLCCGFCGSSLPTTGTPHIITTTRPNKADAARFLRADNYRPRAVRQEQVTVSLCDECKVKTRYADRKTWTHIVTAAVADEYTDEQLHTAGASLIRPLFETHTTITGPQLPWSHIPLVEARIALAQLEIDRMSRDHRRPHKSNQPCGSCGVTTSEDWVSRTIAGHCVCCDCGEGMLANNDFATGRRIKSMFGTELKVSTSTPYVPGDALRPWADTDREGTENRWGYVSAAEREQLRAYLCAIGHPLVPQSWKDRFAKPKAALAPVARKPEKVGAVGIAV